MSRTVFRTLVAAQFLSALSDNAILFVVVAMVLQSGQTTPWYIPALQSVFLVAFVTLGPWAGPCAEKFPKSRVLVAANLLKSAGTGIILSGGDPLLGYSVVGAGAALYSPAKYGILPELVAPEDLVATNSGVEGATIAAILMGTVIGAKVADHSISLALSLTIACYLGSAVMALRLPAPKPRGALLSRALPQLRARASGLLTSARARLVLASLSLFWASAATLRIVLVAWAPSVLGLTSAGQIAELTLYLAIGIVLGSAIVPRMIPLDKVRRTRHVAGVMALQLVTLSHVDTLGVARALLVGIGIAGGMFVVPLNATMQQIGHASIGSGAAVAIQNMAQNATMLLAVGIYTVAAAYGGSPSFAILALGLVILSATLLISQRLPQC